MENYKKNNNQSWMKLPRMHNPVTVFGVKSVTDFYRTTVSVAVMVTTGANQL
jgi:hypothetical protein